MNAALSDLFFMLDMGEYYLEGSSDEDKETSDQEDTGKSVEETGSSPNKFYSSIAKALAEEGVFPDLDSDSLSKIKSPEDFREAINNQIKAGLDERQQRIDEALNAGVEGNTVKQYETTISYLNSIKDDDLEQEGEKGEQLRKQLIYQDLINRGFSQQRAQKSVQRAFESGTDIEDAKDALQSNTDFYKAQYSTIIQQAKQEEEQERKEGEWRGDGGRKGRKRGRKKEKGEE